MLFKKLLSNKIYEISLSGIVKKDGIVLDDIGVDDRIELFHDKTGHRWPVEILRLVAHYEMNLPEEELKKVSFVDCNSKLLGYKCGKMVIHKEPIVFKEKYRVVPGLHRYAVSSDGEVVSTKNCKLVTVWYSDDGYPKINAYDADKRSWRPVCLHILLARAWILNDDPIEKLFVNHIDGIKDNYNLDNLEWVTSKDNNLHAIRSGLRFDNIKCKIYDTVEESFESVMSIASAGETLGYVNLCIQDLHIYKYGKQIPRLLKNRFFVLEEGSDFTEEEVRNFKSYKYTHNVGPYQAMCSKTLVVTECSSIPGLARKIGCDHSKLGFTLRRGGGNTCDGYMVRSKSSRPWPEPIFPTTRPKRKIIARSSEGVLTFDSLRKACIHFGCDKTTIKNRLSKKIRIPYMGWSFEEIT